jgi:branched-chain amino acid transport system ATP-binding protein
MGKSMLELVEVHTYYGNIHALKGVSFTVEEGEVVTLIGSNGAGKSTTLRTIQGLLRPRQGTILLEGVPLETLPTHEIVARGVSQSPEGRLIFPRMTVLENLEMGAYSRRDRSGVQADIERMMELFPKLAERKTQKGGTLSGGEQQMLAMGRALMARPRVMLLDEPSMGLAPILVEQIFQIIRDLNAGGTTILLVEQNATMALGVASRGYVMETGTIALSGSASDLRNNRKVQDTYLGVS